MNELLNLDNIYKSREESRFCRYDPVDCCLTCTFYWINWFIYMEKSICKWKQMRIGINCWIYQMEFFSSYSTLEWLAKWCFCMIFFWEISQTTCYELQRKQHLLQWWTSFVKLFTRCGKGADYICLLYCIR